MIINKLHVAAGLTALALISNPGRAAESVRPPIESGQAIRELQKQPNFDPIKSIAPLQSPDAPIPAPLKTEDLRFDVTDIRITGNRSFPTSDLKEIIDSLIGGKHSFRELQAGADQITAWYRERGFIVARAYLPEQDIIEGVVNIRVMEGQIGKYTLNNQSRISDDLVKGFLLDIRPDTPLRIFPLNRSLLLLNETPGVGLARASLQPGKSVGTSDIAFELTPGDAYYGNFDLDNHGNYYSGQYRAGGTLSFNSPFEMGEQFSLRALLSNESMLFARLGYQMPLGGEGLKMGGTYSYTQYKLGGDYAKFMAHGSANNLSLYTSYPFIRSQTSNLTASLTWEGKWLDDLSDLPTEPSYVNTANDIAKNFYSQKNIQLINVGATGNERDSLFSGGLNSFDAALAIGSLSMDIATANNFTALQNGTFIKLNYSVNRLQRLSDASMLFAALSGQWGNTNLNSSEKFSLGGANGVRAYPQGEGSGDSGWMMTLEARQNIFEMMTALVFFDMGTVTLIKTPVAAGSNTRDISGLGLGLNAEYWGVQLKSSIAWSTSGGSALSEPASGNNTPRIWLQLSGQF
ncbi:MAG: ShlB/FhaC/HecB family hemolysin secretion/activation protein [Gallionellaceae bacterium]|jgi:hemolysin activation/secretion protein